MLFLITGQPGNGKTLYTLGLVEAFRREQREKLGLDRAVYQSGIPGLTLDWQGLDDPKSWPSLPDGSIVVIDECQRVFPPRKTGAEVPPHVREFETHRHRGFDVFLITQHPQLLDIAVRKLTGRHYHLRRTFGQEVSTVLQWEEATDPNDRSARGKALTSRFAFPKERYAWYKSAEVHTVKRSLPKKPLFVLAGSVLAIAGLAWFASDRLMAIGEVDPPAVTASDGVSVESRKAADVWTADALAPRVPHWAWSAPFYDAAADERTPPRITGCMMVRVDNSITCRCHNGQGAAQVSGDVCRDFMAGKVFDPLRPWVDAKAENIAYLNARDAQGRSSEGESAGTEEPPTASRAAPGGV